MHRSETKTISGPTTPTLVLEIRSPQVQDGDFLREKEGAVFDAPQEFKDHVELITKLTDMIDDESVRVQLLDAIETLVHGMNGPWHGARVGWQWGDVPDDLASLFDEGGI